MKTSNYRKFFTSIIVPSILAIGLFIISFFAIIIPEFEANMMERKKEMLRELTNTAISIIKEHHKDFDDGIVELNEAQNNAVRQIEQMRYGSESKDYFWIIDSTPAMIMHPYRKELNGKNLSTFEDSHAKKLFVDATVVVKNEGEGFIDYYWQWKDDTSRVVPKLSYVKGFQKWNWIVGTGIYLEDVKTEIQQLKNRLLLISASIIFIIIITLIYVIRQSLNIEKKREVAEQNLLLSKEKYKNLVDASTEGTLMFTEGIVTFNNQKFSEMIELSSEDLFGKHFNEIFTSNWEQIQEMFSDPDKTITIDTKLKTSDEKDIVIAVTNVSQENNNTYIVVAKDISPKVKLKKSSHELSEELRESLLLMNHPIISFIKETLTCSASKSIRDVSTLMKDSNKNVVYIREGDRYIGAVNNTDLRNRVLTADLDANAPISEIMSAPLQYISEKALLFEAVLEFKRHRVSHLLVRDSVGNIKGDISNQDALEMQRNTLTYLLQEIETSRNTNELKAIYQRVPTLINAFILSSDNAQSMTRIISTLADTISKRVIDLALEQHGESPCSFAFMVLGSEGRKEQTLKTDQDNAIVISNACKESDLSYFHSLAKTINKNLHTIGYNYCEGEIMANNPKWCQSLDKWKEQFTKWTNAPDPQSILDSSIFYDFRFLVGDKSLIDNLRIHVNNAVKDNGLFFYHMSNSVIKIKPTADSKTINLKKLLLPFIAYFRLYALREEVEASNTVERISQLANLGLFTKERETELIQSYNFLMHQRLKYQAHALLENDQAQNTVELDQLSVLEQNTLKKITNEIDYLQRQLGLDSNRLV